jgi:hypothetical protein
MNSKSILLSVAVLLLASISCIYGYTNSYGNFQITFYTDGSCTVAPKTVTLNSVYSQSYSSNEDFIKCTTYPDVGTWPGNAQSVQFRENYSTCGTGGYYCQTLSLYSGTNYCSNTVGTLLASFNYGSVNIISGTCVGISAGSGNNIGYYSAKVIRTNYYNGYTGSYTSNVTITSAGWAGIAVAIVVVVLIVIICGIRRRRALAVSTAYAPLVQPTPVTVIAQPQMGYQPPTAYAYPQQQQYGQQQYQPQYGQV